MKLNKIYQSSSRKESWVPKVLSFVDSGEKLFVMKRTEIRTKVSIWSLNLLGIFVFSYVIYNHTTSSKKYLQIEMNIKRCKQTRIKKLKETGKANLSREVNHHDFRNIFFGIYFQCSHKWKIQWCNFDVLIFWFDIIMD